MTTTPKWLNNYQNLMKTGISQRKACKELGIHRKSVQRWFKKQGYVAVDNNPRILLMDIEVAPALCYTFGRFKQNIGQDNIIKEGGYILTAAWKWLGEPTVHFCVSKDLYNGDDSNTIAELYEAINASDVVVAHHGDGFDLPLLKARAIINGFPPFKTVKTVDTLKIAKQLKFPSNKLDSLAASLGLGRKLQHDGISLWIGVMNGVMEDIDKMVEYNKQDVILLEAVYLQLRAFDQRPANLGQYYEDNLHRCPACGSSDITETGEAVYTPVSKFAEVGCGGCGHRSRKRQAINSKERRATLLISPK